jgi:hypothetical protein
MRFGRAVSIPLASAVVAAESSPQFPEYRGLSVLSRNGNKYLQRGFSQASGLGIIGPRHEDSVVDDLPG